MIHLEEPWNDPRFHLEEGSTINEVVAVKKEHFKDDVLRMWKLLRAVDAFVDEAWEAFGEDPCLPAVRDVLDHAKERVGEQHKDAQKYVGEFALEEPGEEELEEVRTLAERELL